MVKNDNNQQYGEDLYKTFGEVGTRVLGWVKINGEWGNKDTDLVTLTKKVLQLTQDIVELRESITVGYLLKTDKQLFGLVSTLLRSVWWERDISGLSEVDLIRAKEIDSAAKHFILIPDLWVDKCIRQIIYERMRREYEAEYLVKQ